MKNKSFHLLYVMAGFVVFVVAWFAWHTPSETPSSGTPDPARPEAERLSPDRTLEPDASNVSSSTHTQLQSLRMRIIEAPDDTTHLVRLARLLQDAHKPEEAARNYKHYLALHPDNYQVWLDMTQSFGQARLWDEALIALNDMLDRYPDDPSALYNLGAVYANLGRNQEARQVWQRTIDQNKEAEVTLLARTSIQKLPLE